MVRCILGGRSCQVQLRTSIARIEHPSQMAIRQVEPYQIVCMHVNIVDQYVGTLTALSTVVKASHLGNGLVEGNCGLISDQNRFVYAPHITFGCSSPMVR